jgi:hypothetical protein
MSAWQAAAQARSRHGMLAAAAARASAWIVEPGRERSSAPVAALPDRPVVAVVGLGRGCGTTTVARALAVELALRDPHGAALVGGRLRAGPPVLAMAAARRLSRALAALGDESVALGRLSIVDSEAQVLRHAVRERLSPVVIDVPHGTPPEAAAALADVLVLVTSGTVEPALAEVVRGSLARAGREPLVVHNRSSGVEDPPAESFDVVLPEARVGARLALAGREPRGALAEPIAELAELCAASA